MLPNQLSISVLGNTIFISCKEFNFSFTPADSVVKEEFKGEYKYFGGLQSNYSEDSEEYKNLEIKLSALAESILIVLNRN